MKLKQQIQIAVLIAALLVSTHAFGAGCPEPSAGPDVWKQALLQIDQYRSTYVLMYADRSAERITAFGPSEARIVASTGAAADFARKHNIQVASEYPTLPEPGRIAQDLLGGSIDGAVVWAPLAGWLIAKYDDEHQLSMHAAPEAASPPREMAEISATVDPSAVMDCSNEVRTVLEAYGVVPAQAFQLNVFEVLQWKPNAAHTEGQQQGQQLFQRYCASCHGQDAVRRAGLAPVDLLKTARRSTYGGFAYMTLHGRNIKGMPGYHGILDKEQVQLLYEYVQQQSKSKM